MTLPDEISRYVNDSITRAVAGLKTVPGTVITSPQARSTDPLTVVMDGSAVAMPVKQFRGTSLMPGMRVGLARIGSDWVALGSLTNPGFGSGATRMVIGADTPPELQAFGIDTAILSYVRDVATGIEVGYHFIGSSNRFDGGGNSRVMAFGNVTYPTAGVPSSATQNDVKTNFQMDMWAQFAQTIFKDHQVTLWTGLSIESANAAGPLSVRYDGNEMPRGWVGYGVVTAGSVATSSGTEVAIPAASWATEPNVTFRNQYIYQVDVKYGYGISTAAANYFTVKVRKGSASITGQVLGQETFQETTNLAFANAPMMTFYVKNTSGGNITTALSLTIIRNTAANNCSLYGNGGTVPLRLVVQELGLESGHSLSGLATAIT